MFRSLLFGSGVVFCALSACAMGPAYQRPPISMRPAFRHGEEIVLSPSPSADAAWWMGFHDPLLTQIIERTLAQNLDLEEAAARVAQARAVAAHAGAALLPEGNLGTSASQSHDSLTSPIGEVAHTVGAPRNYQTYGVGAQAPWELDRFGWLRGGR